MAPSCRSLWCNRRIHRANLPVAGGQTMGPAWESVCEGACLGRPTRDRPRGGCVLSSPHLARFVAGDWDGVGICGWRDIYRLTVDPTVCAFVATGNPFDLRPRKGLASTAPAGLGLQPCDEYD